MMLRVEAVRPASVGEPEGRSASSLGGDWGSHSKSGESPAAFVFSSTLKTQRPCPS